jgi:hypothetical protein
MGPTGMTAGPGVEDLVTPLVEAVMQADEATRRSAVRHLVASCLPVVIRLLARRLVEAGWTCRGRACCRGSRGPAWSQT